MPVVGAIEAPTAKRRHESPTTASEQLMEKNFDRVKHDRLMAAIGAKSSRQTSAMPDPCIEPRGSESSGWRRYWPAINRAGKVTLAFARPLPRSKSWINLKTAVDPAFAGPNFCRG